MRPYGHRCSDSSSLTHLASNRECFSILDCILSTILLCIHPVYCLYIVNYTTVHSPSILSVYCQLYYHVFTQYTVCILSAILPCIHPVYCLYIVNYTTMHSPTVCISLHTCKLKHLSLQAGGEEDISFPTQSGWQRWHHVCHLSLVQVSHFCPQRECKGCGVRVNV